MSGIKKGPNANPFVTYDENFTPRMDVPYEAFSASRVSGKEDQARRNAASSVDPVAVELPKHLFIPFDAQSVDLRRLANVPPGDVVNLIDFTCPKGLFTKFISYSIFCDALLFNSINFVPTVNGKRVFPFHGDPQANYKIGLGTGPDLSNANTIACQLDLQPGDQLLWTFTNNDTVDVAAGVRMIGYVDQSAKRKSGRFGG